MTLLEPVLPLPPSALTYDDWARLYGEEFADWMRLAPAERWRESCRLWEVFFALGGRLHDDRGSSDEPDDFDDNAPAWRPRSRP